MKLISFALLLNVLTYAESGWVIDKKELSGQEAILEIANNQTYGINIYGLDPKGEKCHGYILMSEQKDFLEVVLTDRYKRVTSRFFLNDQFKYKRMRKMSESNSSSSEVGFHTITTYSAGRYSLSFTEAGDSYYEISIKHSRNKADYCSVDF